MPKLGHCICQAQKVWWISDCQKANLRGASQGPAGMNLRRHFCSISDDSYQFRIGVVAEDDQDLIFVWGFNEDESEHACEGNLTISAL